MSNTFDFSRFSRLINRQWIGFGKIYLMSLVIIAGIFMAFFGYHINQASESQDAHDIATMFSFRPYVFTVIGLAFIAIVSSSYFSGLGQKSKAIFEILIPASQLEKFLSAVFYTALLTTASYFLLFYLIDFGFVSYARANFHSAETYFSPDLNKDVTLDRLTYFFVTPLPDEIYWMLFLPFLLSAIFLLGSIAFKNFHFIKTATVIVAYCFVFILATIKIMTWITKDTVATEGNIFFNEEMNIIKIFCAVGIVLTLLLWGISFLRLKEKEV
ncbi:hypothetical protein HP439_16260 [Sphingobacterium shayense]|uniref:hypothetical protein n=1 Tax=Sphingobacterium shayense TaxID=626343 RepID=UPI001551B19B|nr:hypothetical protein [Sphingobacterium shayense]NQD72280.1 hypothetical protein [Sphingobacterium shayense]